MTATSVSLKLRDLWAPILLANAYLAAVVVFPRDHEQFAHLHIYFAARRKFVVGMLPCNSRDLRTRPFLRRPTSAQVQHTLLISSRLPNRSERLHIGP
jgi:hypothetical protein